jgi:hypothetical protein
VERFVMKRWQTYRELEMITDSVLEPQASRSVLVLQLDKARQRRMNRLLQKLPDKQQVQHLEQCLALEGTSANGVKKSSIWRNLWLFLNQPIFELSAWSSQEPKVQQVSDQGGQVWWYVYDPQTHESVYLESETEVLIWLEEHLSR